MNLPTFYTDQSGDIERAAVMMTQRRVLLRRQNGNTQMTKSLIKRQSSRTACMEGFYQASGVTTITHKSQTVRIIIISIQYVVNNITRAVLHLLQEENTQEYNQKVNVIVCGGCQKTDFWPSCKASSFMETTEEFCTKQDKVILSNCMSPNTTL